MIERVELMARFLFWNLVTDQYNNNRGNDASGDHTWRINQTTPFLRFLLIIQGIYSSAFIAFITAWPLPTSNNDLMITYVVAPPNLKQKQQELQLRSSHIREISAHEAQIAQPVAGWILASPRSKDTSVSNLQTEKQEAKSLSITNGLPDICGGDFGVAGQLLSQVCYGRRCVLQQWDSKKWITETRCALPE
ncbi:hypothetical protein BJ165DRAFT_1598948 [Panaeolus papilionaceus]|nr:hypothetical protein BJ165DRAFT_1598948 [Panaeolus papilionaceus]